MEVETQMTWENIEDSAARGEIEEGPKNLWILLELIQKEVKEEGEESEGHWSTMTVPNKNNPKEKKLLSKIYPI